MFAQITTVAFDGIEALAVDVQVQLTPGLPAFNIVGLPDKTVAESRERVRSALYAMGMSLPPKRITINLAPADMPKEGSHYDLPIALGIMGALGAVPTDQMEDYCAVGELALDGTISPVNGGLPAAIGANSMGMGLICPAANGPEAAWLGEDMDILAPESLLALVNHFKGSQVLSRPEPDISKGCDSNLDMRDIKGHEAAKRAMEVAAAGNHNILLVGPAGSGKSMLASRLPSIMPTLQPKEMLEVSMIRSLAGELAGGRISDQRPFRAPHHSASMAALAGGGVKPRPGEIALAHMGVLFLDELPEFSPQVIDALRQPLESGQISIARANHRISYPARVLLVAAMNPCKCGRAFEPGFACSRGAHCAERYQARISGPLLDRIDLNIEVPSVSAADLMLSSPKEGSKEIEKRVAMARKIQEQRYLDLKLEGVNTNASIPGNILEQIARPDTEGAELLRTAANDLGLSARGYHRTLRMARTLADLDGGIPVGRIHIAEALGYRGETMQRRNTAKQLNS
jgi:magnesium chelatase family protein